MKKTEWKVTFLFKSGRELFTTFVCDEPFEQQELHDGILSFYEKCWKHDQILLTQNVVGGVVTVDLKDIEGFMVHE